MPVERLLPTGPIAKKIVSFVDNVLRGLSAMRDPRLGQPPLRALARAREVKTPRFYFDLKKARDFAALGQTPWTPPVSVAFGEPFDVSHHPRNSKGYRVAAVDIQQELRKLWEFLVTTHEQGRPRNATPPA